MSYVNWKPVFVDGKLHSLLHIGDRVMVYEIPEAGFTGDKKRLVGIATLCHIPDLDYWEYDGQGEDRPTLGIKFTKSWAELPELPDGE